MCSDAGLCERMPQQPPALLFQLPDIWELLLIFPTFSHVCVFLQILSASFTVFLRAGVEAESAAGCVDAVWQLFEVSASSERLLCVGMRDTSRRHPRVVSYATVGYRAVNLQCHTKSSNHKSDSLLRNVTRL